MGVIGFRKAKCKDCYKCVRLCEVKAIRIKDEHAQFVASECVECGQCLEACPQNAITFIKDIQWIKSMVKNREKTVVSLAGVPGCIWRCRSEPDGGSPSSAGIYICT